MTDQDRKELDWFEEYLRRVTQELEDGTGLLEASSMAYFAVYGTTGAKCRQGLRARPPTHLWCAPLGVWVSPILCKGTRPYFEPQRCRLRRYPDRDCKTRDA